MRIEIDCMGSIKTLDDQGRLHSFNGKPACIGSSGVNSWYERGFRYKTIWPNGVVDTYVNGVWVSSKSQ